ncbi:MAG: hypothetical protein ACXADD_13835 [Candidatus Thorarchaeota archaeon]|jgi:hypothetical protein
MRWAAGIIFYNDKDSLERCLNSIHETIDFIFCIDGKFKMLEANHETSVDGSRELVQEYSNTVLVSVVGAHQVEKRNKYLELAEEYKVDVMLHIDSDEYVVGDLSWFRRNLDSGLDSFRDRPKLYNLQIITKRDEHTYIVSRPRIYHNPGLLRLLSIRHHTLYDMTNEPPTPLRVDCPTLEGIQLHHDDELRNREWLKKMFDHQKWQILYELQWHFKNHGVMKEHIDEQGYNRLDLLLEKYPVLKEIMDNYEYRNVCWKYLHYVNPEFAEYVDQLKAYLSRLT